MALIAGVGYLVVYQQGVSRALPLLGLLALAAQRLLPMAQKIYEGWAICRSSKDSLASLLQLLNQKLPANSELSPPKPLKFRDSVCFQRVSFRYSQTLPKVLDSLTFEIHRGERIGIIGTTGCGKSTAIDLLMGLLHPLTGKILIDGKDLHELGDDNHLRAWWSTIAHVPQNIYLADSSIAENIALGVPNEQINWQRVRLAAEQAQIAEYIGISVRRAMKVMLVNGVFA